MGNFVPNPKHNDDKPTTVGFVYSTETIEKKKCDGHKGALNVLQRHLSNNTNRDDLDLFKSQDSSDTVDKLDDQIMKIIDDNDNKKNDDNKKTNNLEMEINAFSSDTEKLENEIKKIFENNGSKNNTDLNQSKTFGGSINDKQNDDNDKQNNDNDKQNNDQKNDSDSDVFIDDKTYNEAIKGGYYDKNHLKDTTPKFSLRSDSSESDSSDSDSSDTSSDKNIEKNDVDIGSKKEVAYDFNSPSIPYQISEESVYEGIDYSSQSERMKLKKNQDEEDMNENYEKKKKVYRKKKKKNKKSKKKILYSGNRKINQQLY